MQATCESLEQELDDAYRDLDGSRQSEAKACAVSNDITAQLAAAEGTIHEMGRMWLEPKAASQLRSVAEEWQAKHDQMKHRYGTLADDFQHLSGRKAAVEAERLRQQQHRHRTAALHAGLASAVQGLAELEARCCNVPTFPFCLITSVGMCAVDRCMSICTVCHRLPFPCFSVHCVHGALKQWASVPG